MARSAEASVSGQSPWGAGRLILTVIANVRPLGMGPAVDDTHCSPAQSPDA